MHQLYIGHIQQSLRCDVLRFVLFFLVQVVDLLDASLNDHLGALIARKQCNVDCAVFEGEVGDGEEVSRRSDC